MVRERKKQWKGVDWRGEKGMEERSRTGGHRVARLFLVQHLRDAKVSDLDRDLFVLLDKKHVARLEVPGRGERKSREAAGNIDRVREKKRAGERPTERRTDRQEKMSRWSLLLLTCARRPPSAGT